MNLANSHLKIYLLLKRCYWRSWEVFLSKALKQLTHVLCHFVDHTSLIVVDKGVSPYQRDVFAELLSRLIQPLLQVRLDFRQIHWILDHLVIIQALLSFWINFLQERTRIVILFELLQYEVANGHVFRGRASTSLKCFRVKCLL